MRRAIVPLKEFNTALAGVRSRVPLELIRDIVCRLAAAPESAPCVAGRETRVLHTRSYAGYPAFSLFYQFDERALYLVHVELRDELEAYDEAELWTQSLA